MSTKETVVITGASSGVGRALARRFADDGASIALIARGVEGLEGARREVEEAGAHAISLPLDVADAEALVRAAARIEDELGPVDIWINNAMTSVFSPVKEMRAEEFKRVTEVTYLGYVYATLAILPRMLARDQGHIVQVGSALAYRGIPLQSAYCAAKHAIQGFCDSLRTELLHDHSNVRLTMVQLPAVNTPQFDHLKSRLAFKPQPVPPIFQPEVVAEAIHWAAHRPGREMLVGWPTLKAVLGNKLVPGYADKMLAKSGYESQQTDEPEDSARPDNLWHPVPGDPGAHGRFDDRAISFSPQVWLSMHRRKAVLGAAALVAGGLAAWYRKSSAGAPV